MNRGTDLRRAAEMAYRVLIDRQVTALPVDPMNLLRQCRDTQVMTYEDAAEALGMTADDFDRRFGTADAFTLRQEHAGKEHYLVIYRAGGNPARQRFTLAHELGHRVLGHRTANTASEREADCFASHLLCPRPVIARLAGRCDPLYAEQLAALCYVSVACARAAAVQVQNIDEGILQAVDELLRTAVAGKVPVVKQNCLHKLVFGANDF